MNIIVNSKIKLTFRYFHVYSLPNTLNNVYPITVTIFIESKRLTDFIAFSLKQKEILNLTNTVHVTLNNTVNKPITCFLVI